MKYLILIILFSCSHNSKTPTPDESIKLNYSSGNAGHRLGGDVVPNAVENTLEVLAVYLDNNGPKHESHKYLETDINSTKDHELVIYHDKCFERKEFKGTEFYKKCIRDLSLEDIKKIKLPNGYAIPTLSELLKVLVDKRYQGRILFEVKRIQTDEARESLVSKINKYKEYNSSAAYLAFSSAFKKSFPNKKYWCPKTGVVHKAGKAKTVKNDYCRGY